MGWPASGLRAEGDSARGEVQDRPSGPPPLVPVPRRDLRRGPNLQQHRGVVAGDPGRAPAAQGSALLSPPGGERDQLLHRLRLRAESAARRGGRPHRPSAGGRAVRRTQERPLRAAPPGVELTRSPRPSAGSEKERPAEGRADVINKICARAEFDRVEAAPSPYPSREGRGDETNSSLPPSRAGLSHV